MGRAVRRRGGLAGDQPRARRCNSSPRLGRTRRRGRSVAALAYLRYPERPSPRLDRLPLDCRRLRRSPGGLGRRDDATSSRHRARSASSRGGAAVVGAIVIQEVSIHPSFPPRGYLRPRTKSTRIPPARRSETDRQAGPSVQSHPCRRHRGAVIAGIGHPEASGLFNVADDLPAPPDEVIVYAASLLGVAPPPAIPFETAELSPMAKSFYGEVKRVSNARLKRDLGWRPLYPTYREGLAALAKR